MSPNYTVMSINWTVWDIVKPMFIEVCNFDALDKIAHFAHVNKAEITKTPNVVGIWKIKYKKQ